MLSDRATPSRMLAGVACLTGMLILAGCQHSRWFKPGGTLQGFGQDSLPCRAWAQETYPVALRRMMILTPATRLDPNPAPQPGPVMDMNAEPRANAYNECMFSRGWSLVDD